MPGTAARLLRLLALIEARRDWSGVELAERLEVGVRTVWRDVDRLRALGDPVRATAGVGDGCRLGAGTSLPLLLLDDVSPRSKGTCRPLASLARIRLHATMFNPRARLG